jgi:branched-chain amino acid transport system permease protein
VLSSGNHIAKAIAAALACYILAPLIVGDRYVSVLVLAAIYTVIVAGLNVFMGFTGQVSFGHNAFVAIGGYSTAVLTVAHDWTPMAALGVAIVVSLIASLIIGYPLLRLRGRYLAMGTFALGLIAIEVATQWKGLTRGSFGIAAIPPFGVGGFELESDRQYFYFYWLIAGAVLFATAMIREARVGRAFRAIASDEQAALALGIDISRYKLMSLAVSAALGALGGSMMAHYLTFVSPDVYDFGMIMLLFSIIYVGGIGSTLGPLLGALAICLLPELLRGLHQWREIVYGVLVLAILLFAPRGLYGLRDLRIWSGRRPKPVELPAQGGQ